MAPFRKKPLYCLGLLKSFVLLFLTLPGASLFAQTLEIKLVDGRNGRPMVGSSSYVNIWVGNQRKEAIAIPADGKGIARMQLTLNSDEVNIPNSKNSGSIVLEHPIVMYDDSFRMLPMRCAHQEGQTIRGWDWKSSRRKRYSVEAMSRQTHAVKVRTHRARAK
jgi:hypothetical protein